MPSIQVSHLGKRFGAVIAVDDVSFTVNPGSVAGFLGPNGAGKSTTLRMLVGLVRPTTGTATINGRAYVGLDHPRHVVGAALETVGPYPGRSAVDHLRIEALAGDINHDRVDEVLAAVDLTGAARRRVGTFSLGMRQRLNVATALLGDPEILLLDEPTNGLDPEGIRWIRGLVRSLAAQGRAVLVSSHLLGEVANTADEVIVMNRGRVLAQAPIADFGGDLETAFLGLTAADTAARSSLAGAGSGGDRL